MNKTATASSPGRLSWVDSVKGISILWIAFFHFFLAYDNGRFPWPINFASFPTFISACAPASFLGWMGCVVEGFVGAIFQRGSQAVGVFVLLSGFGLTYSLARRGYPEGGWGRWYRRRLVRLFPMYWAAHLIYLVSPFVHRQDAVDYRFLLSLLGDRMYPVETMFYYMNPALWFFGLLLELYLAFPLLFLLQKKLGVIRFFAACAAVTIASRYLLFAVLEANGNYVTGAVFLSRLWEFAAGMTLGRLYRERPEAVEKRLFAPWALACGAAAYLLGVYSYGPGFWYTFTDALTAMGLFVILLHVTRWLRALPSAEAVFSSVGAYSYGLYLIHQPYVIYFGQRLSEQSMLTFLASAFVIVTLITLAAMPLEKTVNRLTDLLHDRFEPALAPMRARSKE